ncbi:LOW QUALITY PROTEIN: hypothetical protein OSB04_010745 [Centaurea solstitialis]|uniref:Leucine-rich repeat-containing N-terminal plant-type domain-containing protein n=1 Tax=Centaurea solstitialis TaxID=347529 RepID=A0AA38WPL2_9ASTR|nr:LOW QUALITY PROTEIN: hypothetical protein OSB04_010745 [Centaurea solstitialis]
MELSPSLLSIFFILTFIPIPSSSCPLHHKQSLLQFKSTLTTIFHSNSDPTAVDYIPFAELDSWNRGSDCCSWARVKCGRTRNVTELHLTYTVPWFIDPVPADVLTPFFEIRSLKVLDISRNFLQGEIPGDGFGNLTELVHLDLNGNTFNGSIPGQIFRLPNLSYLDMSNNSLEGELPPELGSFQDLTTLRLSGNRFHGPIPTELYELESLQVLDVGNNALRGVLAPEVGKLRNLELLELHSNFLSGSIPEEIGNITRLRDFSLANNKFSGGIPSSIEHLNELRSLYLWGNSFSMQIPANIGKLSNIKTLDLSYNRLKGPIPSSMRNMTKLELLWLTGNTLAGEIPPWLFEIKTLKKLLIGGKGNNLIWNNKAKIVPRCRLQHISMTSCRISGHIPKWISSQKNLDHLDLRDNHLTGKFPDWLAEMDIGSILLSDNNLNGSLPSRLFQSPSLGILALSQNNFSGVLPENIGNASAIMIFILSGNKFSGQIPMFIKNIHQLWFLDFTGNKFSGEVPDFGENPLLAYINLSNNELSGESPTTFSTGTQMISLGGNKFSGDLSRNLTNLVNLKHLDLHDNNITGSFEDILARIPGGLQVLNLRNNSVEGFIPRTISNLTSLRILDLSGNNLTGSIPPELGSLERMIEIPDLASSINSLNLFIEFPALILNWKSSFQGLSIHNLDAYSFFDLSNNKICGEIPASLGNLKGLKQLNLSHNNISGLIPTSFGNMKSVETLDLSHNKISGLIPESLTKLDELTYLDVSNNRLTGKIPVGGQMTTMNELKFYANNNGLCGMQIRIKCPRISHRQKNNQEKWKTIMIHGFRNFNRSSDWVFLIDHDHGLLTEFFIYVQILAMIKNDKKNPIGKPIKVSSHEIHELFSSSFSIESHDEMNRTRDTVVRKIQGLDALHIDEDFGISPKISLCEILSSFRPLRFPNEAGISSEVLLFDKSKKEYISKLRLDRPRKDFFQFNIKSENPARKVKTPVNASDHSFKASDF